MNRVKVNVAKEKILKLREKYSKNTNKEEVSSSLESLISSENEKNVDKSNIPSKEQIVSDKSHILSDTGDFIPISIVSKEDLIKEISVEEDNSKAGTELVDSKIIQESKFDNDEQPIEKQESSDSLVLSELSNQFECIRFVASSSEDLSSVGCKSTQTKSVSTDIPTSDKIPELNNSSNKKTESLKFIENIYKHDRPITGINSHHESLSTSKPNDSLDLSSIKELINSGSEINENIPYDTKSSDESKNIIFDMSVEKKECANGSLRSNIKAGESNTDTLSKSYSDRKCLKTRTNLHDSDLNMDVNNSKADGSLKKQTKHKHKKKKTDILEINTSSNKTSLEYFNGIGNVNDVLSKKIHHTNQSTNTDPVRVTLLKEKRCPKNDWGIRGQLGKLNKSKHLRKHTEVLVHSNIPCFNSKQTEKKKFIKPCNLISKDEIKYIESKRSIHQEELLSLDYKMTEDIFYHPTMITDTAGISSDDIITLLLRNQIQLTRHFMESHHRMYLQVSKAAQLLNGLHSTS